jgi:tetratricopeptide (TPR) repeat protein
VSLPAFVTPIGTLLLVCAMPLLCGAQVPALRADALQPLPPAVRTEVERAYESARARPDDPSAAGRLAMTLHAYDQLELASAVYDVARQLDPRSLAWAYLSGVVQAELGRHAAAAEAFELARRLDPEFLPVRLRLAESLMKGGELERSRDEYAALVKQFPELALAHYGLGQVLVGQGNSRAAVEHHRRAVDLMPRFGPAHYAAALAYRDLGLNQQARWHLAEYGKYGSRRPALADRFLDEVRSMKGTARDLIAEGANLGRAGRLDESIEAHRRALDMDATAAQAHVNLISLYGRTGEPEKAEEHYKAVLRLGANVADAHYNYGVLLAARGRHTEAAAAFRHAIEVNPFHAQAHNNLGGILAQEGRLDEALGHFQQAVANDPQHRAARFNLGRVLLAVRRHREAIDQLSQVLMPEDADTPRYMFTLAEAYHRAGDVEKARHYAEEARRRAETMGQTDLAARIASVLQQIGKVPQR